MDFCNKILPACVYRQRNRLIMQALRIWSSLGTFGRKDWAHVFGFLFMCLAGIPQTDVTSPEHSSPRMGSRTQPPKLV